MHIIQQKLLNLAAEVNLGTVGLRKLGQLIGETHPQKVKHHLEQLEKKGLVTINRKSGEVKPARRIAKAGASLFRLPILGTANCGPATIFAEENFEGYLQVSPATLGRKNADGLFIIKAVGDSMNRAKPPINNGDYVVIDSSKSSPQNGDYVLSIIDDTANIKRFYRDSATKEIALVSESTLPIEPIYVHASEVSNYVVSGQVLKVIKRPKV